MNWKQAKKSYEEIEIPEGYSARVEEALASQPCRKRSRRTWYRPAIQIAAACCALFVILVNSSEVFAKNLYDLPVIGTVARIFTFREYKEEDEYNYINIKVPAIQNTGNNALEDRINQEITFKINQIIEEAKEHAREYYEAYKATGGEESTFHPVELYVDYTIYYQSGELLSFVIDKCETFASAYTEKYYYNIDLKYGRELTLHDVLGDGYLERVNDQIRAQITQRVESDENQSFFEGEEGFSGISENQHFYINEKGKVVVVFDRYSIAPGYMSFPAFEIDLPTPYAEETQS